TCMLTAGCVMMSRSAAALNDSQSTTAQNTSRCRKFKGWLRVVRQRDQPGVERDHSRLSRRDSLSIGSRLLGLLPRHNLDARDAQAIHLLDDERPAVNCDGVTDLWTPAQVTEDKAAQRVVIRFAEWNSQL